MFFYPPIDEPYGLALVYRECPCGAWCATGEGERAPLCGHCGHPMLTASEPDARLAFEATLRFERATVEALIKRGGVGRGGHTEVRNLDPDALREQAQLRGWNQEAGAYIDDNIWHKVRW